MMSTLIHDRVALCQSGKNPTCICRLKSGWAVLGDFQYFRGYSLLLADPVVPSLHALTVEAREKFLLDMAALGDAVLAVTDAVRINYEILGNAMPALHAHVFPRYSHEPPALLSKPVWLNPLRKTTPFNAKRDQQLLLALQQQLKAAGSVIEA